MSISKKLRFEVFKRDGFQCAYCGKSPPAVILEVDHIDPKSAGGGNDINNLLTACFDCNRGKTNVPLKKIPLKLEENLEILKAKEEQLKEYRRFVKKIENRLQAGIETVNDTYTKLYPGWEFSDRFQNVSLKTFLKKLTIEEVIDALYIATNKFPNDGNVVIRYFCGICWKKIKGEDGAFTQH